MLNPLHRLAVRLYPRKQVITITGLVFLCLTVYALLLEEPETDLLLRIGIAGALWSGLLFAFLELFQHIPRPPRPDDGLLLRLGLKIKRGFYTLLSALVVLLTLLMVSMSLRLAFL